MPRKRTEKTDQPDLFDRTVEDPELELMLEQQLALEPEAQSYRKVKKGIRARIESEHADLIGDDGVDSGWVRCGRFRFRPKAAVREEGEVKIGAGINWTCPVEAL